jgi:ABC-type dipeptide/oligopeptide/nickel transport system permease subunit
VIGGGIVLIAGTVLLIALLVMRATGDRSEVPDPAPQSVVGSGRCAGGALPDQPLSVPLPAGARIEQVAPDGGCLLLLGTDGAGRQFVALVDPLTGARISLLLLRAEP